MYGPVRTVVWEGRSREAPPYPDRWHFSDMAFVLDDVRCCVNITRRRVKTFVTKPSPLNP